MTENIDTNSTFLIDLNTTEEGSAGVQVHYVLSNTDTEGNVFSSAKLSSSSHHMGKNTSSRYLLQLHIILHLTYSKIVSEYDQEIPQSQTADKPMAARGRATQPSRHFRKTN